ncbi:hypothetical protein F383_32147 [Gossypium arboreum]|uniref:Uncharacterized protein n=1 Tax=Gossypium arboreum TaxID=29729 RepID=A0A0B0N3L2_GOSAR|nr:hypothetical protein F383_32147 [Gossypium arboreum]
MYIINAELNYYNFLRMCRNVICLRAVVTSSIRSSYDIRKPHMSLKNR